MTLALANSLRMQSSSSAKCCYLVLPLPCTLSCAPTSNYQPTWPTLMFLPHVACSTARDPAPFPAPQLPGTEGLSHCASQTWGWWLRFPSAPTHGLKAVVRRADYPSFAGGKGRGGVSCSLPMSLSICLWCPALDRTPELIPKGRKTEMTGRGRSFLSGRAAFARDVVLPWGLARGTCASLGTWLRTSVISELCSPWTSSTSIPKENLRSLSTTGIVQLPSVRSHFSLDLASMQNKLVPHFGRVNAHHSFRSQICKLQLEMQFFV